MATKNEAAPATVVQPLVMEQPRVPRKVDPPRDEQRARVRVKFGDPQRSKVVAQMRIRGRDMRDDGWVYPPPVYEGDLWELQACVETEPAALQLAREMHDRNFQLFVDSLARGAHGDELNKALEHARATYPGSVEAEFQKLTGRGHKPFVALEILERGLPPPETERDRELRVMLDRLGAGSASSEVAQLRTENAALNAKLDQQGAELARIVAMLEGRAPKSSPRT